MLKLISKLDFVVENNLEVSEILKNKKYLLSGKENYFLDLYSNSKFNKILKRYECLKELNLDFSNAYVYEKVGNLDEKFCYIISKKIEDVKNNFDFKLSYEKGLEIGRYIKKFHTNFQSRECQRWERHYSYRINKVLHKYGLGKYKGDFDYILFDFLESNKYLIKDRTSTTIFGINSFDNIVIDSNGKFFLLEDYKILRSDSFFEFLFFNSKDIENRTILAGIIDGYFVDRVPRLFFKLLAIYTIVENLYEILDEDEIDFKQLQVKIDEINEVYDKFSTIYPTWYLTIKNKLEEENNV